MPARTRVVVRGKDISCRSHLGAVLKAGSPWALLALAGCLVTRLPARPLPSSDAAIGEHFAIATEHPEATRAAIGILRSGGLAVDAAVAATFVLGVVTPTACGIGGGGFALGWNARGGAYALDFRETAPASVDAQAFDRRPLPPHERGHLVGVPGEVAGLSSLVERHGTKTLAELLTPAIDVAERGFALSAHVRKGALSRESDLRTLAPALGTRLLAGGAGPLPVGSRVTRPDLARTLRTIQTAGSAAFYRGPLAGQMVDAVRAAGGTLSEADLANYRVAERTPLRVSDGSRDVLTMPPPSAGGLMLGQLLVADRVLRSQGASAPSGPASRGLAPSGPASRGLAQDPPGSAPYLHRLAVLMRGAQMDRQRLIGDPAFVPANIGELLSEAHMAERLRSLAPSSPSEPAEHGTSHLSVVDARGNALALTTTINGPFGARLLAGDTGILLNDELDDFGRSTPGDATSPSPNVPRPGARPTSSMTPTIVLENGKVSLVLGGSGGTKIATSVSAVAVDVLLAGTDIVDAVRRPRVHPAGPWLVVEPSMPSHLLTELTALGEHIRQEEAINAVQAVAVDRQGRFHAAADPRKGGSAAAE